MKKVLVLGANGRIARWVIDALAEDPSVSMTLLVRNPAKLPAPPSNATVVTGDALDTELMRQVVSAQDVVYANLTGDDLGAQARSVIDAMHATDVRRLVFVLALGIYDEVPGRFGEWNRNTIGASLPPFREAADAIEGSGLDYTVLRPGWLTDDDEVDYETTAKGEPFRGTVVSRKSVADLVLRVIAAPHELVGESLGVNKPNSDADKPYFM